MPIIVACPTCNGKLRVADDLIGRKVRCPACNSTFEAAESAPVPAPAPVPDAPVETVPVAPWRNLSLELSDPPAVPPPEDIPLERNGPSGPKGAVEIELSKEDESPCSPEKPAEKEEAAEEGKEESDLRPCPECGKLIHRGATRCFSCGERVRDSRTRRKDEEDDRPRRRSRRDDEDEDEDYPRPRRRPRRDSEPHRGGMVLTFGLISAATLFVCWPLAPIALCFGIAAWWMGSGDLRKIRAGTMDPDGEGTTQAGWICGIVGVCLNLLAVVGCGLIIGISTYMEIEEAKKRRNQPFMAPPAPRMQQPPF
jgi:predicted Zn finger-like uncharacterized protein